MDLDNEELKNTRTLNGIDRMIEIDYKLIDKKIRDLKKWQEEADDKGINDDWYYFEGEINALKMIKEGKLGEL